MSFAALYAAVQEMDGHISTRRLRDKAIELSRITAVKEQWTGIFDTAVIRGFYVEGPLGPPVPLAKNESLIVLARQLDRSWRRIVYAKELMHVFDSDDEVTDTEKKLEAQAERLTDSKAEITPQSNAENKALFRAVSLFCPETRRLEYKRAFDTREMSLSVIAAALRIPEMYARHLVRDEYTSLLNYVMK